MATKTAVLSAFGEFGGYPSNPTETMVHRLYGAVVSGFTIEPVIFDADIPGKGFDRGKMLFTIAKAVGASAIIALGMDSGKTGLCPELQAKNLVRGKYCPEELDGARVDPRRPEGEIISLDLRPWNVPGFSATCREKDIPIMGCSRDMGGFCCNHLAYQARVVQLHSSRRDEVPFIFVHVPCSPEAVPDMAAFQAAGKVTMSIDKMVEGIEILLANASI